MSVKGRFSRKLKLSHLLLRSVLTESRVTSADHLKRVTVKQSGAIPPENKVGDSLSTVNNSRLYSKSLQGLTFQSDLQKTLFTPFRKAKNFSVAARLNARRTHVECMKTRPYVSHLSTQQHVVFLKRVNTENIVELSNSNSSFYLPKKNMLSIHKNDCQYHPNRYRWFESHCYGFQESHMTQSQRHVWTWTLHVGIGNCVHFLCRFKQK